MVSSLDLIGMVAVIAVAVLMVSLLAIGAVLVVRDTIRRRGMWGINLKRAVCAQCGTPLRRMTFPSWHQWTWGGWTCHECGFELNKWGRSTKEQNTLAKWAVLRAAEDADENERRPPRRDERIRDANDQTQRGDAP